MFLYILKVSNKWSNMSIGKFNFYYGCFSTSKTKYHELRLSKCSKYSSDLY